MTAPPAGHGTIREVRAVTGRSMTTETLLLAMLALMLGAVLGYGFARRRRAARVSPLPASARRVVRAGDSQYDDDTKPTLVPFRSTRESGRNLAKLNDSAAE